MLIFFLMKRKSFKQIKSAGRLLVPTCCEIAIETGTSRGFMFFHNL